MVDMLVESSNNVEMILKFFDMFLKLKDLTFSDTFKEYDPDGKGKAKKLRNFIMSWIMQASEHLNVKRLKGVIIYNLRYVFTGVISKKDFQKTMESHKHYTQSETEFLLSCAETDENELLDYEEFVERFHEPAKVISKECCNFFSKFRCLNKILCL